MEPFGTQGECLHNGWIDVDPTRGAEAISLDIAVGSGRICLEGSRVEFSVHINGRARWIPVGSVEPESRL